MAHEHMNPDRFADSAGVPWAGRTLQPNPHSNDDGSADPALLEALVAFGEQRASSAEVVSALGSARVLVPLIANLGDSAEGAHGQKVDKSADLSIVSVKTPDGQEALPVFTSVATMNAWNPQARPVPVQGQRAALAAATEGQTRLVIDAGSETEFVLRRPAIWALAQNQPWIPAHVNEQVFLAFKAVVDSYPQVLKFNLADADPTCRLANEELQVRLGLSADLSENQIEQLVARLSEGWASQAAIPEFVDSLHLKIVAVS
ncbi:MAG: SseB family protein [Micrococcales bacterium]